MATRDTGVFDAHVCFVATPESRDGPDQWVRRAPDLEVGLARKCIRGNCLCHGRASLGVDAEDAGVEGVVEREFDLRWAE